MPRWRSRYRPLVSRGPRYTGRHAMWLFGFDVWSVSQFSDTRRRRLCPAAVGQPGPCAGFVAQDPGDRAGGEPSAPGRGVPCHHRRVARSGSTASATRGSTAWTSEGCRPCCRCSWPRRFWCRSRSGAARTRQARFDASSPEAALPQSAVGRARSGVGIVEGWRGPDRPPGRSERRRHPDPGQDRGPCILQLRRPTRCAGRHHRPDFPLVNKSFNLSYTGDDQ